MNIDRRYTKMIGKTIKHQVGKLYFDVKILNVHKIFGRIEYKITPISGEGTTWIVADKRRVEK